MEDTKTLMEQVFEDILYKLENMTQEEFDDLTKRAKEEYCDNPNCLDCHLDNHGTRQKKDGE